MTGTSTVAAVKAQLDKHEAVCNEHRTYMATQITELKDTVKGWRNALWGVVAAIAVFGLTQLVSNGAFNRPQQQFAPQSATIVNTAPAARR
jgi:hypothetical protein